MYESIQGIQCTLYTGYTLYTEYTVYLHTVHDTHVLQVAICSHYTDDALYSLYVSTFKRVCNF